MKKKNYSKRAIAAANGFLANYHLTVEHLTEAQKQSVLYYVKLKSSIYWALPLSILGSAIFIYTAWGMYSLAQEWMQMILIPPTTADASLENSFDLMLKFGILIGEKLCFGIMMLVFLPTHFFTMRVQKRTLDAFLPFIASDSDRRIKEGWELV